MATDLPSLLKAVTPRQKVALEQAIEAAIDAQVSTLKTEIQAMSASAADFAEFQIAIAQWAPYEG